MLLRQSSILQRNCGLYQLPFSNIRLLWRNSEVKNSWNFGNMPGLPCKKMKMNTFYLKGALYLFLHIYSFCRSGPMYRKSLQEEPPRRIRDRSNMRENEGIVDARKQRGSCPGTRHGRGRYSWSIFWFDRDIQNWRVLSRYKLLVSRYTPHSDSAHIPTNANTSSARGLCG